MRSLRFAAMLAACTVAGAGLEATVILPASLEELVTGARAIVHGRVVVTEPRWADGRRQIETLVTVRPEEYLKGDLGGEVTFKVPGGQMGPYRRVVVGAPTFREGDEVVVFLNAQGPAVPWISGLNQGVFRVAQNAAGVKVVIPGVSLTAGENAPGVTRQPLPERLVLRVFNAQVRALTRARVLARPGVPTRDGVPAREGRAR
ncbi:MAG TPA: hypothetical protein VE505_09540 [Vicinamibacterales bacterium]|nr:hypothetical protein [Vicinamibacterales bacterium]